MIFLIIVTFSGSPQVFSILTQFFGGEFVTLKGKCPHQSGLYAILHLWSVLCSVDFCGLLYLFPACECYRVTFLVFDVDERWQKVPVCCHRLLESHQILSVVLN